MTPLQLIIRREYLQDINSRSFWISTIVTPILLIAFGIFIGMMSEDSDTLRSVGSMGQHQPQDLSTQQLIGLLVGMLLTIFLMVYGSMIFNKVKAEKTNRIMEMIATTVSGRTMMLGKIVAVAFTGLTQILAWFILIAAGGMVILTITGQLALMSHLADIRLLQGLFFALLYFSGGYVLFGSMYAMVGAMTDKDNENQGYIIIITFILMASFYIASFSIDNPGSSLALWCGFIPFTSPGIGTMSALAGTFNIWQILISLGILYGTAYLFLVIAGKVYTSAMLLNGVKFSPRDIITFIKAK